MRKPGGGCNPALSLAVEFSEKQPRLRPRRPCRGVDPDPFHWRQIDHQATGANRFAGIVMPAAADRNQQLMFPGKAHAGDDVGCASKARD